MSARAQGRQIRPGGALIAAAVLLGGPAAGAEVVGPVHGRAVHHDVSMPLRQVPAQAARPTGLVMEVNPLRAPLRPPRAGAAPAEPDSRRQTSAATAPGAAPTPAPALVVEGLSDDDNAAFAGDRVVPPDAQGDIGPDHYVQWINLILAVWDVSRGPDGSPTGATLDATFGKRAGNSIWAGFGDGVAGSPSESCENNNDGDPIVLYDHLADRWLLSQFVIRSTSDGIQCMALSQSGDPTGTYHRWAFNVSPGQDNDYPKLGLMPGSYFLSLRDFPSSTPPFASAVAFDRAAMLAGDPNARTVKWGLTCDVLTPDCVDGWQPPHLEGPPPPGSVPGVFTKVWDDDFDGPGTGCDGVRLWRFDVDWSTDPPGSSLAELPRACGGGFDNDMCDFFIQDCIPQASSTQLLDPLDELQMYRAQYRQFGTHDSLLVNSTVDAGGDTAGIRWIELRDSGSGWAIHQEGTYAPDTRERWMGSAAMNGSGEIALGFSVSGGTPAIDPSIAYNTKASEASGEPQDGVLSGGEVTMHAGTGAQTGANRWGDYSAMSVDPADDCTFWYTQEYYANTASFDFKTKIGAFRPPGCVRCSPPVNVAVDGEVITVDETHESCGWVTSTGTTILSGNVIYRGRHGVALGNDFAVLGGTFAAEIDPDVSLPP